MSIVMAHIGRQGSGLDHRLLVGTLSPKPVFFVSVSFFVCNTFPKTSFFVFVSVFVCNTSLRYYKLFLSVLLILSPFLKSFSKPIVKWPPKTYWSLLLQIYLILGYVFLILILYESNSFFALFLSLFYYLIYWEAYHLIFLLYGTVFLRLFEV